MAIQSRDPDSSSPEFPHSGRLSREAFVDLLEASAEGLWMLAAAISGDPSEAEDILQDAAMAALGKLDQFQPGTSFIAWMGTFVRNTARNVGRKHQRRATRPAGPETLESLSREVDRRSGRRVPRPEEELHRAVSFGGQEGLGLNPEAFDDAVQDALMQLTEEARAALLLRVVHDLSYREVGQALGIPEGTAASHVSRARHQLKELLLLPPSSPLSAPSPGEQAS